MATRRQELVLPVRNLLPISRGLLLDQEKAVVLSSPVRNLLPISRGLLLRTDPCPQFDTTTVRNLLPISRGLLQKEFVDKACP